MFVAVNFVKIVLSKRIALFAQCTDNFGLHDIILLGWWLLVDCDYKTFHLLSWLLELGSHLVSAFLLLGPKMTLQC